MTMLLSNGAGNYDGVDDAGDDVGVVTVAYDDVDVDYYDKNGDSVGDWDDGDGYGTADGDDGYVDYDNDDTCADTDVATCGYIYAYGVAGVGNVTTVDGDADDTQYDEDAEEGDGADVDADNGEYDTEDVGVDTVVAYDGGDDAVDDAGEYADGDDADCGVGYVVDGGDDSCDDGDYDEPDTNSGVVVVDDIAVYVDNGTCTDNCVMMVMPMLTMVILLAIRVMMLCMWW